MNYRHLANESVNYLAELRDRNVDMFGIVTKIRRPDTENKIDFYGDFSNSYLPEEDISCVPQYDKYYQVINILGQDIEVTLPLEAIVKIKDYIPNDSVIKIGVRNNSGETQLRWWRVLSTEIKHIESHYARVAKLAPVREPIGVQAEMNVNITSMVTTSD